MMRDDGGLRIRGAGLAGNIITRAAAKESEVVGKFESHDAKIISELVF